MVSQITRFQYRLGKTHRGLSPLLSLLGAAVRGRDQIERGYHSLEKPDLRGWGGEVVECTIPVGALYFRSPDDGYLVSSSIRIDRTITEKRAREIELETAKPIHYLN